MQKRRKYSREYKLEAVQLAKQSDITLTQVAHNLGINANMLARCFSCNHDVSLP